MHDFLIEPICHCADCRHVSGGAGAAQIAVPRDQVAVAGPVRIHERSPEAGLALRFGFCERCGAPVT